MRMPLTGGEVQVVFHQEEPFDVGCGRVPGTACTLLRQKQNGDSVSLFDPMTGIEKEVVKTQPDDRGGEDLAGWTAHRVLGGGVTRATESV